MTGLTVLHDRERLPNTNLTAFNKLHFSLLSILSFDRSLLCTFDEDRVCYYYVRSFCSRSESLMFTFSRFMCLCFYSISCCHKLEVKLYSCTVCGLCDRVAGVYLFAARSWVVLFIFINVSSRSRRSGFGPCVLLLRAWCHDRACVSFLCSGPHVFCSFRSWRPYVCDVILFSMLM